MIAIIDYGVGNLSSVRNMLRKNGERDIEIVKSPNLLLEADHIILPGVGHFDHCMKKFSASGLLDAVAEKVLVDKTPLLGICVGHQMLFDGSEEGHEPGLGWIQGSVQKFDTADMKTPMTIPHMAWTDVEAHGDLALFRSIKDPRFYFVHSYYAVVGPDVTVATAHYGHTFTASVQQANIFGVQFHPEKSHKYGMALFQNFINWSNEEN